MSTKVDFFYTFGTLKRVVLNDKYMVTVNLICYTGISVSLLRLKQLSLQQKIREKNSFAICVFGMDGQVNAYYVTRTNKINKKDTLLEVKFDSCDFNSRKS